MRAFRLENIVPAVDAAKVKAEAEKARADAEAAVRRTARDEGYAAGYMDGQAAATEAYADEQAKLSAALVEAISDGQLTNEAARRAVIAQVMPIVQKLFAALAPVLADAGMADEIAARVEAALKAVPGTKPRVRCAPEVAPVVEAILRARALAGDVEAAPELLPREAEVAWAQGFDRVDLDACIREIQEAVAAHMNPEEETGDAERLVG